MKKIFSAFIFVFCFAASAQSFQEANNTSLNPIDRNLKVSQYEAPQPSNNDAFIVAALEGGIPQRTFENLPDVTNGFYLVSGVFSKSNKLNKQVKKLTSKGFDSGYFKNPDNDLYYLYVNRYTNWETAIDKHQTKFDNKFKDEVWILHVTNSVPVIKPNSENKAMDMLVLDPNNGTVISSFTRMDNDKKIPVELLVEGDFDQSLEAYQALMKEDLKDPTINENNLNGLGYRFLGNDQMKIAKDVFKVNMMLYPESFNVYDSYAEACMKMGDIELAIENYKRSLSLNPENNNAKEFIKKLQEQVK